MSRKSVERLFAAGYTFLRERDFVGKCGRTNYAIVRSDRETGFGNWKILESFETKAARKRRLAALEDEPFYLV
jgi:hypothetical protein